eukprot:scaffold105380_cov74-Phaeocystis_antarctica.AAC.8
MLSRGARVRELQGTRGDQCTTVQSKVLQKGRPVHLSTRGRNIWAIRAFDHTCSCSWTGLKRGCEYNQGTMDNLSVDIKQGNTKRGQR